MKAPSRSPSGASTPLQTPTTPAHALVARAHSPSSAARIYTDKIATKPLLLQPTTHTDKRALRRHIRERKKQHHTRKQAKKGNKPLSAKEKRRLGIYRLRRDEVRGPTRKVDGADEDDLKKERETNWEVWKGLNELWNGYMLEVLGYTRNGSLTPGWERKEVNAQNQGGVLVSCDLHGAWVEVVRSRDQGRVGVKGVVVRETKFQIVVVGERGGWWCVPKRGCVFAVTVRLPRREGDGEEGGRKVVFEIVGRLFEYRPVERANRKFKWRAVDDV